MEAAKTKVDDGALSKRTLLAAEVAKILATACGPSSTDSDFKNGVVAIITLLTKLIPAPRGDDREVRFEKLMLDLETMMLSIRLNTEYLTSEETRLEALMKITEARKDMMRRMRELL